MFVSNMVSYGLTTIPRPLALGAYTHTKGWFLRISSRPALVIFRCVTMCGFNGIKFYSTRRGTFLTLCKGNQITIDSESKRQSYCTNIRYSYQQELLYFRGITALKVRGRREREREKRASETEEQRQRRLEKRCECDRKRREYENKRRQKHRELETIADKEGRLLTRIVHRMKGETTLQTITNH